MIPGEALPQPATAYQFLESTALDLSKLVLPTGPVTVQFPDALNGTQGRCYVMTTWGTATLSEGDWIILYDIGLVVTVTQAQFPLLYEMRDDGALFGVDEGKPDMTRMQARVQGDMSPARLGQFDLEALQDGPIPAVYGEAIVNSLLPQPEVVPVLKFRVMSDGRSWLPAFENYCTRHRLDYSLVAESSPLDSHDFRVVVNATGREVVRFNVGDLIVGYPSGRMELVGEDAE